MLNVRKLAAIDLHVLGAKLILSEFGVGVIGPMVLGLISWWQGVRRFHSPRVIVFGAYLILLGLNYVPLLLHVIDMARNASALEEIADELGNKQIAFRKYRRQSLLLLVPLVVPIAAVVQEIHRRRSVRFRSLH